MPAVTAVALEDGRRERRQPDRRPSGCWLALGVPAVLAALLGWLASP